MFDWLNSSVSIFLVLTLAGSALFIWRRRWLKTAYAESCKTLYAACTTSTRETPEAAWITALRASVARDAWKPGLKPSAAETQVQLHPSYCDVPGHTESAARRAADAENGTLGPPIWFWYEYIYRFRDAYPNADKDKLEAFKYQQDLSSKIWLAAVSVLLILYFWKDIGRPELSTIIRDAAVT